MVCLSASATSKLIDELSDDYDVKVMYWKDDLMQYVKVIIISTITTDNIGCYVYCS